MKLGVNVLELTLFIYLRLLKHGLIYFFCLLPLTSLLMIVTTGGFGILCILAVSLANRCCDDIKNGHSVVLQQPNSCH